MKVAWRALARVAHAELVGYACVGLAEEHRVGERGRENVVRLELEAAREALDEAEVERVVDGRGCVLDDGDLADADASENGAEGARGVGDCGGARLAPRGAPEGRGGVDVVDALLPQCARAYQV